MNYYDMPESQRNEIRDRRQHELMNRLGWGQTPKEFNSEKQYEGFHFTVWNAHTLPDDGVIAVSIALRDTTMIIYPRKGWDSPNNRIKYIGNAIGMALLTMRAGLLRRYQIMMGYRKPDKGDD